MTPRNLLLLGLSSIALQGCIAAAAIPIVAGGGALVRDTVSDDARSNRRERAAVVPPPAPTPAPTPTPALASAQPAEPVSAAAPTPAPTSSPTPAPARLATGTGTGTGEPVIVSTLDEPRASSAPASTPAPAAAVAAATPAAGPPVSQPAPQESAALAAEPAAREPATDSAVSDAWAAARETAANLGPARPVQSLPEEVEPAAPASSATPAPTRSEEPPAGALAASAGAASSAAEPPAPAVTDFPQVGGDAHGYGSLRGYALRTLGGGLPLPSAMLADPTSLQPVRRDCQGNSPTVVIDLDPQGGVVPIVGPLQVNTELARILADLRLRDVQIAWITDRGPIDARAVRDRLVASGLDPNAQDSLYVERYPGETKQARRTALAQTQCVIALAGDERSDFDDLYNFIREPGDARNLELLLGNGWFLIENPVGG